MEGEGQDYGGEVDLDYGICHTLHMIKRGEAGITVSPLICLKCC